MADKKIDAKIKSRITERPDLTFEELALLVAKRNKARRAGATEEEIEAIEVGDDDGSD